jgi:HD superfamily phosphohydrolase
MEVRDPIHGAIGLTAAEASVADHPFVQRLRGIAANGFSHLPFPGATHTRYAHSLGVMHLAGMAFDQAYRDWTFTDPDTRARLRQCVRLAALCHDLGHAPFSHCTEFAMPPLADLQLAFYPRPAARRATHEDYTIAILEHTSLAREIASRFPFESRHVAALVSTDVEVSDGFFRDGGYDHRALCSQIVSSELDVDRLDYLVRDATFTGARYGQIEVDWLLSSLAAHPVDREVCLALESRALYAFDHFLIARHHMFLMVYFHHKSVVYEEMLRRWVTRPDATWRLPSDLDAYLRVDDVSVTADLRASTDPWARRIVERQPFRRVVERHGTPEETDLTLDEMKLENAGIPYLYAASSGKLSRYDVVGRKRRTARGIWVLHRMPGLPVERAEPLMEASAVFERYRDVRRIARLYAAPEDVTRARDLLGLPS